MSWPPEGMSSPAEADYLADTNATLTAAGAALPLVAG
jgi:hypothetical protein